VLNIEKINFYEHTEDTNSDTHHQPLEFNQVRPKNGPITRAHPKFIDNKTAAHLELFILKEEGENEIT
jgi:hypothetical protein